MTLCNVMGKYEPEFSSRKCRIYTDRGEIVHHFRVAPLIKPEYTRQHTLGPISIYYTGITIGGKKGSALSKMSVFP